jgi:hypothetical protein
VILSNHYIRLHASSLCQWYFALFVIHFNLLTLRIIFFTKGFHSRRMNMWIRLTVIVVFRQEPVNKITLPNENEAVRVIFGK